MWFKWCFVLVAAVVITSRCDEEEEPEEQEDGPTTPRPPPPIALKNLTELVKVFGYEAEEFEVKTSDGYKLGLFHIKPKIPGGPVVIVSHAAGMSPDAWCLTNYSLVYMLVDRGADTWLPSARGSVYSRKHEKLNPDTDQSFWEFSFVEMAELDFPAVVDFVVAKTKQPSVYYVGYSLGTTVGLIGLSRNPEYNVKIKEAVMMGPMWHCTKYQFMINKESSMYQMVLDTFKGWDEKKKWEGFPRADVPSNDHQLKCSDLPEMAVPYCEMGIDMIYNAVGEFLPAGLSVKLMKHIGQAFVLGKVLPWDYDSAELNKKTYSQDTPPEYDLKKITAKINLFWSQSDQLVDDGDAQKLASELSNVGVKHRIEKENFNHPDFVMASTPDMVASTIQLNQEILKIIKK